MINQGYGPMFHKGKVLAKITKNRVSGHPGHAILPHHILLLLLLLLGMACHIATPITSHMRCGHKCCIV